MKYLSKNRFNGFTSLSAGLCLAALIMLILTGCASTSTAPVALYPVLGEKADAMKKIGYTPHGRFWSYSNGEISIQVHQVTQETYEPTFIDVLDELAHNGYTLLLVEIKNMTSGIKITYNPALTSLTTDSLDFKKPLDYTDFYELTKESVGTNKQLVALSKFIYDNTQTISPAQRISKYLVFTPLKKDFSIATLEITEIYIGTKTYSFAFPFLLQEENALVH